MGTLNTDTSSMHLHNCLAQRQSDSGSQSWQRGVELVILIEHIEHMVYMLGLDACSIIPDPHLHAVRNLMDHDIYLAAGWRILEGIGKEIEEHFLQLSLVKLKKYAFTVAIKRQTGLPLACIIIKSHKNLLKERHYIMPCHLELQLACF